MLPMQTAWVNYGTKSCPMFHFLHVTLCCVLREPLVHGTHSLASSILLTHRFPICRFTSG